MTEPTAGRRRVPQLMLILTPERAARPLPEVAAAAVAGGVDGVRVRAPGVDPAAMRRLAEAVAARVGGQATLLIGPDPTLARALGAGVHLAEREGPAAVAAMRALLGPAALVGRSVHSPEAAAASPGADYLLVGHVFPSASHPGEPPLGVDGMKRIVAAAPCPVLAVGGITAETVGAAVAAGATGVAVMSAVAGAPDPEAAARALRAAVIRALEEGMSARTAEVAAEAGSEQAAGEELTLTVNGKPLAVAADWTVHDLLASRRLTDAMAVVERNGVILNRSAYAKVALADGDRLEIVHAVGGG